MWVACCSPWRASLSGVHLAQPTWISHLSYTRYSMLEEKMEPLELESNRNGLFEYFASLLDYAGSIFSICLLRPLHLAGVLVDENWNPMTVEGNQVVHIAALFQYIWGIRRRRLAVSGKDVIFKTRSYSQWTEWQICRKERGLSNVPYEMNTSPDMLITWEEDIMELNVPGSSFQLQYSSTFKVFGTADCRLWDTRYVLSKPQILESLIDKYKFLI